MINKNKNYRRNEDEQGQNDANDINGLICCLKVEPCFDSCGNEKDSPQEGKSEVKDQGIRQKAETLYDG